MAATINNVDLNKALAWCRKRYNDLRTNTEFGRWHPSHAAARALEDTAKHYPDLGAGTLGTEGWSDECGRNGITYLNTGDTYDLTLCFDSRSERFLISSWGDLAEAFANETEGN